MTFIPLLTLFGILSNKTGMEVSLRNGSREISRGMAWRQMGEYIKNSLWCTVYKCGKDLSGPKKEANSLHTWAYMWNKCVPPTHPPPSQLILRVHAHISFSFVSWNFTWIFTTIWNHWLNDYLIHDSGYNRDWNTEGNYQFINPGIDMRVILNDY